MNGPMIILATAKVDLAGARAKATLGIEAFQSVVDHAIAGLDEAVNAAIEEEYAKGIREGWRQAHAGQKGSP